MAVVKRYGLGTLAQVLKAIGFCLIMPTWIISRVFYGVFLMESFIWKMGEKLEAEAEKP